VRCACNKRYDRGSGAIAALGLVAAAVAVTALVLPLAAALPARAALEGAADAAALAAADAASGAVAGEPCANASRVASSDGARVTACVLDGLVATVRVEGRFAGFVVAAEATAGPAGTGT
jgi:secretion/DNA translocation related TadE-like protein